MKNKKWTIKEIQFLKDNYRTIFSGDIAKKLGRIKISMLNKVYWLKISKGNLFGEKNGNWKGGKWICKTTGEIILSGKYKCPYSNDRGRVKEHKYIWWKYYKNKKPILKGEVIHHKNQNRGDNSIKNLKKMKRSEHTKLHNKLNPNKICFLSKKDRGELKLAQGV